MYKILVQSLVFSVEMVYILARNTRSVELESARAEDRDVGVKIAMAIFYCFQVQKVHTQISIY